MHTNRQYLQEPSGQNLHNVQTLKSFKQHYVDIIYHRALHSCACYKPTVTNDTEQTSIKRKITTNCIYSTTVKINSTIVKINQLISRVSDSQALSRSAEHLTNGRNCATMMTNILRCHRQSLRLYAGNSWIYNSQSLVTNITLHTGFPSSISI